MPRFPRVLRLHRSEEFAAVKSSGVGVKTGTFKIFVRQGKLRRLGVITARYVGEAHMRNNLRRIVREYFRLHQKNFPHGDCVVIPSSRASNLSNAQVREELERALDLVEKKLAGGQ